jgi:cbb3-type cytochrome oxidase subunit 1
MSLTSTKPPGVRWSAVVFRLFGTLHILFGAYGFYVVLLILVNIASAGHFSLDDASAPYATESFVVMTAINLIFIGVLLFAGIQLLQLRAEAVRISNWLFLCMIMYEAVLLLDSLFLDPGAALSMSISAAYGIGNMGIAPQVLTGYPIIALIALNLARRKHRSRLPSAPSSQPAGGPPA